jgi:hypothetical protein
MSIEIMGGGTRYFRALLCSAVEEVSGIYYAVLDTRNEYVASG